MVILVSMVFMLLVDMPLSNGYDFIGKLPRRTRIRAIQPDSQITEEITVTPEENPAESVAEESEADCLPDPVVEPKDDVEDVIPLEDPVRDSFEAAREEVPKVGILPEPEDIPIPEEKSDYYEIDYATLPVGKAMDKLPPSKSGNYIIIYRSSNCIYCDKLIGELKGNTGDYVLVVVKCEGTVRDPFYSRLVYNYYPSFIVIKDKVVKYYGYGYRSLEEFKRFL